MYHDSFNATASIMLDAQLDGAVGISWPGDIPTWQAAIDNVAAQEGGLWIHMHNISDGTGYVKIDLPGENILNNENRLEIRISAIDFCRLCDAMNAVRLGIGPKS